MFSVGVVCRMGKHAHRSGKHAMWWSDRWVSMPEDKQACHVVWLGKYAHRAGKHAMGWSGILVGQACSAVVIDLTGDDLQVSDSGGPTRFHYTE